MRPDLRPRPDREGGNWGGEALELDRVAGFGVDRVVEGVGDGLVDDDFAGAGGVAEAGGKVDAVAEDGVVEAVGGAHAAGDEFAVGEADADLDDAAGARR